jgi:sigma-B regulation protein RsbU (phosphoserine phosphatase)
MRRLGIVIADVSGKGISAAILMAFVRPVIRAALDRTADPAMALERTNRILVEERPTGLLVTVLCGILELDTGIFRFANAGHEPPLIVRAGGAELRSGSGAAPPTAAWATTAGPLLGAFRTLGLAESAVTLDPGDALVLYTDGVTDAATADGERFGDERFATLVREHCLESASDAVETVMGAVAAWEGPEPADDLALLVIRRADASG